MVTEDPAVSADHRQFELFWGTNVTGLAALTRVRNSLMGRDTAGIRYEVI